MDWNQIVLEAIKTIGSSSALWGLVGVMVGGLITHKFQQARDSASEVKAAFARLHGLKKNIKQLYVSRFEASIFSDAHEAKWKNSNSTSSIDFEEALRWMRKSEDLVFEITKAEESLAQACGIVLINMKRNCKIVEQAKHLLEHKVPQVSHPKKEWDNQKIDEWKDEAIKKLIELVDQIFDPLFDELLTNKDFKV